MLRKLRLRYRILLFFVILLLSSNIIMFFVFNNLELIDVPHDADRKTNGNTLIVSASFSEMLNHLNRVDDQKPVEPNNPAHKISEVDPAGNVIWELRGLAYPHEVLELPNGHLLIADTGYNRVIEVDYPNKSIIWSWEPAQINWTKVNPEWGSDHYYNNPLTYDWSHLNDVDFKQYSTWNSCLISIRNFDLIVEVNYTADFNDPNNSDNIIWWYGDFENHTLLFRQHNPDYLDSGNVIISDSGNDRIIEINYTTKEVEWKLDQGLNWPRDADELDNGNILITDSSNSRILEVNKDSKQIVWSFAQDLIIPYEADLLDNGNILISSAYNGIILEVNRNGIIVWKYGFSIVKSLIYLNLIILIAISSIVLYYRYEKIKLYKRASKKIKKLDYSILITFCSFLIIGILMLIFYSQILAAVARFAYLSLGAESF